MQQLELVRGRSSLTGIYCTVRAPHLPKLASHSNGTRPCALASYCGAYGLWAEAMAQIQVYGCPNAPRKVVLAF